MIQISSLKHKKERKIKIGKMKFLWLKWHPKCSDPLKLHPKGSDPNQINYTTNMVAEVTNTQHSTVAASSE